MVGIEMQMDPWFDSKLVAVGATLKDATLLPSLEISPEEQQQLLVEEPG